jgi:tetratricopeptide (TPR) repeat protein
MDEDVEALFAYATARRNIPAANNKHLQQAMAVFARILELDPGHAEAQNALLDLYTSVGFTEETLVLADKILPAPANGVPLEKLLAVEHIPALRAKALTLAKKRKLDEALELATYAVDLAPQDRENHLLLFSLMERAGKPADELLAYAEKIASIAPTELENHFLVLAKMQQAGRPGEELLAYATAQQDKLASQEGLLQVLQATAHEIAGNHEDARRLLEEAAEHISPDPRIVSLVNNFLNRVGSFDVSTKLLERAVAESGDDRLRLLLVRQLFERGNSGAVLEKTGGMPLEQLDSPLLAIRALACAAEHQTEQVNAIAGEFDRREGDAAARAWAPLLRAVWGGEEAPPAKVMTLCDEAIGLQPDNPFLHYLRAVACERLGESDLALSSWQDARQYAPSWAEPAIRAASLLDSMGNRAEAVRLATQALKMASNNIGVAAEAAVIIGSDPDWLSDDGRQQLLKLVEQVQTARPLEPRTLPLYVDLLARNGDTAGAADKIRQALNSQETLPDAELLQLARTSDAHGLDLADACYEKAASSSAITPAVAFAKAVAAYNAGNGDKGLEILANAAKAAENTPGWETVLPEYLERTGAPDATEAWAKAADQHPGAAAVQRRVLASRAAWQDTDLIGRVIERVKEQTGEEAVGWRVARARWLLMTDSSEKAAAEAVALLNDVIRTSAPQADRHVLLASAFERLNNYEGAQYSLTNALQIAPESNAIRFQLARISQIRGQSDRARQYIEDALRNPAVSAGDRQRAAAIFASQNEIGRAIALQLEAHPPEDRENPADLLLAELYRRSSMPDKAEAICTRILQEAPTAQAVQFTADLLASQGRTQEAETVLARLDTLETEPGIRELIQADYHSRYGTSEAARRQFEAALAARRNDPAVWKRYLVFLARSGAAAEAVGLFSDAAAACPNEPVFAQLAEDSATLSAAANRAIALPLIVAAIEAPRRHDTTFEALNAIANTPENNPERLAMQLRQLSERHPEFLALKMQLVRLYASINRHDDAAKVAAQAMHDFPGEYEPALLAAEAYAATGQWMESLRAAEAWRNRAVGRAVGADMLIAEAQIQLGEGSQALETLRSYVDSPGETEQTGYSPALAQQARALISAGQPAEAAALIQPRLTASADSADAQRAAAQWRMAWVRLAASEIKDDTTAAEWLLQVTPRIPDAELGERLMLASGWYTLANRSADPDNSSRQSARAILQTLADRPGADAKAFFELAVVADLGKDYAQAETYYLRALDADPAFAVAQNNLAMRYVLEERRLDEALKLAQAAVQAGPDNANYLDTLAQAQAALGNYDDAIQALTRAAELDPNQRKWRDNIEVIKQRQKQTSSGARES